MCSSMRTSIQHMYNSMWTHVSKRLQRTPGSAMYVCVSLNRTIIQHTPGRQSPKLLVLHTVKAIMENCLACGEDRNYQRTQKDASNGASL